MIATEEPRLKQKGTPLSAREFFTGGMCFLVAALPGLFLFQWDLPVWQWVQIHRNKFLQNIGGQISDWGDWPYLMAAGLLCYSFCRRFRRRSAARVVLLMMLASSVGGLGANALRLTVGRTRPNAKVEQGWYGLRDQGRWIITKNQYHSFPSAHTATTFGFFSVGIFSRRRTWAFYALLVPGIVMALCRMVIGAHYLSDVYYGAWFGILAAWVVLKIFDRPALDALPSA